MNLNNEEEVLGLLTRLLDQLHQADLKNFGSKIEIVYVASGGQHVEKQYIASPLPPLRKERGTLRERGTIRARGGEEEAYPDPPEGRERSKIHQTKIVSQELFGDDTPLSALFREGHHEELRKIIGSWRPYLTNDDATIDALQLSHFEFDKDRIYSNKVYRDLCGLDALGALQVSLSQLSRYLAERSNLSRSYATLYQQLKYYRQEWS